MSCSLLSLCLLLTLGDPAEPAAEPKEQQKTVTKGKATVVNFIERNNEALAEAQKLLQKNDIAGAVEVLEKGLAGNPQDFSLLFPLAQFSSRLAAADPQRPDYARHRKAGDYMRRALKANPQFAAIPGVRKLAAPMYYNEACALALDNQADKALEVLGEAVEFGYKDLAEMERDADLKPVRELAGYAAFKAKAEETIRKLAEAARELLLKDVDKLFAENEPFDFDFQLTDTDGQPIALADFGGKVLIVDVWGTWCPPCRMEIPHFVALQKKLAEAGLVIVGLNSERAPSQEQMVKLVQDFRQANGMNYRCALVDNETLGQIPGFNAFPTTMFIDRQGEIRAKVVGYQEYDKLEIIVGKLLEEKFDASKKKTRLTFGTPGFVRKTPWPVPEQGGWQAHVWVTAFSPDGRTYLVGGDSGPRGIVRLFDVASGKVVQEFSTGKDVWFANATFLPGGQQLVTAYSADKNIYLWDVATGKLVREFAGHSADGVAVVASHDGRHLVSVGKDNTLRLWDAASAREIWSQDVAAQELSRLLFSPSDQRILTSGADRVLRVRDAKTGALVATLEGHTASPAGDFSADGKQILSWGEDGQIRLWDIASAKIVRTFEGRPENVRQAWPVDNGRQVLTWGKDLVFRVWDAENGRKLREISVPDIGTAGWNEATVSPDGRRLLMINSDGADVRLVDLESGEQLYRSQKGRLLKARGFSFSPDGKYAAAGSFRNGVFLVELPMEATQTAEANP